MRNYYLLEHRAITTRDSHTEPKGDYRLSELTLAIEAVSGNFLQLELIQRGVNTNSSTIFQYLGEECGMIT